jgi:hypothetical protein
VTVLDYSHAGVDGAQVDSDCVRHFSCFLILRSLKLGLRLTKLRD